MILIIIIMHIASEYLKKSRKRKIDGALTFILSSTVVLITTDQIKVEVLGFMPIKANQNLSIYLFLFLGFLESILFIMTEKNNIIRRRIYSISLLLIIINVNQLTLIYACSLILYEIQRRSIRFKKIIDSNLYIIIPFIVMMPIVLTLNILNFEQKLIVSILLSFLVLLIDINRLSHYRLVSVVLLTTVFTNYISFNLGIILSSSILIISRLMKVIMTNEILQRGVYRGEKLDKWIDKIIILLESRETVITQQPGVTMFKPQVESVKIFNLQRNDVKDKFLLWIFIFVCLALYVIFRSY